MSEGPSGAGLVDLIPIVKAEAYRLLQALSGVEFTPDELYWPKMVTLALLGAVGASSAIYGSKAFQHTVKNEKNSKPLPQYRWPIFLSFLFFLSTTFGGGMTTAILRNKPFFFFFDDRIFAVWAIVWLAVLYAWPVFFFLVNFFPIKLTFFVVSHVFIVENMMEIGETAFQEFKFTLVAPTVFMYIMGNGGGMLRPCLMRLFTDAKPQFPLMAPGAGHVFSFLIAILYNVIGLHGMMPTFEYTLNLEGFDPIVFKVGPRLLCVVLYGLWGAYDCVNDSYTKFWSKWFRSTKTTNRNTKKTNRTAETTELPSGGGTEATGGSGGKADSTRRRNRGGKNKGGRNKGRKNRRN